MNAPTFTLKNTEEQEITLPQKGLVVLYFYPKASTPGCTIEGKKFSDLYPEFIEVNTLVIGISPDPLSAVCKFNDKHSFNHVLLADPDHKVAEKYGVWNLKKFMGKEYKGVDRTTFLIHDGKIIKTWEKHKPGKTEEEILEYIKRMD